jgi:hypothetical protein
MTTEGPGRPAFDPASVPRSVWISAGGALVLLISVFLNWYTAKASVDIGGASSSFSTSISGWDATKLVSLLIVLAALATIAAYAIELFAPHVTLPFPAWMIAGAAGALSVLLILFRIVNKPDKVDDVSSADFGGAVSASAGTAFGIWLALIAAIAVVVGAYLRMNES